MIELIVAIVIMGIALTAVPNLVSTSTKGGLVGVQQEGINLAAIRMEMIMNYPWDENENNGTYPDLILHVSNGATGLEPLTGENRRAGTPEESRGRVFSPLNASTTLGSDAGDSKRDDFDDWNGVHGLNTIDVSAIDNVIKVNFSSKTNVFYMSDLTTSGNYKSSSTIGYNPSFSTVTPSTNIKGVKLTVDFASSVKEINGTIILYAFSCNSGTYKPLHHRTK